MVKSELIENLAERADITLAKAEEIVDLFFDSVTETLCSGNRVEIRGFGAFTVREYKAYEGRNPKTGEKITKTIQLKDGKKFYRFALDK